MARQALVAAGYAENAFEAKHSGRSVVQTKQKQTSILEHHVGPRGQKQVPTNHRLWFILEVSKLVYCEAPFPTGLLFDQHAVLYHPKTWTMILTHARASPALV